MKDKSYQESVERYEKGNPVGPREGMSPLGKGLRGLLMTYASVVFLTNFLIGAVVGGINKNNDRLPLSQLEKNLVFIGENLSDEIIYNGIFVPGKPARYVGYWIGDKLSD